MINRTLFRVLARFSARPVVRLAFGLFLLPTPLSYSADSWIRGISVGTRAWEDVKLEALMLESVSKWGESGRMSGSCAYYNYSPAVLALEGSETSDGDFYPIVTNQVANDKNGEWKTLKRSVPHGKTATLMLEAKSVSKLMTVDLDSFVPMIGKFKYGRLVLNNGESAIFLLDYLLPPNGAK